MPKAYSTETKERAVELCSQGLSQREVARRLGVSQTAVRAWSSVSGRAYYESYKTRSREDAELKARRAAACRKSAARPEAKKRRKERYETEPSHRILELLRCRTRCVLRGGTKSIRTEALLGISAVELVQSWNAEHGSGWQVDRDLHIDHIRPCASFDLTSPDQQYLCFNWRNLQLLSAAENASKGDSWTPEMELTWIARMQGLDWDKELFLVFSG